MSTQHEDVIADVQLQAPGHIADPQWYAEYDALNMNPPELVISLEQLQGDAVVLWDAVYYFLREHGLDHEPATDMAHKLIERRFLLHPATLGIVVKPVGAGHWQIIAERGA